PFLEDETTLVMTAARADRTSFGCSDESEMTYFGRAYFEQALPHSDSFVAAFEQARMLITQWEERDFPEEERSEPQIALGSRIAAHLRTLTTPLLCQEAPAAVRGEC